MILIASCEVKCVDEEASLGASDVRQLSIILATAGEKSSAGDVLDVEIGNCLLVLFFGVSIGGDC